MVASRPHLLGLLPDQLVAAAPPGLGLRLSEARRILAHRISGGQPDLVQMARPVRRAVRDWVGAQSDPGLAVVERVPDPADGSVRLLLQAPDGAVFEVVCIPLHKAQRWSVCLSSQVGCAMGCVFCATGRLGLQRHLAAWEMVGAFMAARSEILAQGGRPSGAVFMGQGEPFHNYEAVLQAAQVLSHPCGGRIGAKAISISTVGLVPQIHRFAAEGHKYRLVISLTSAQPGLRRRLLPVAGKWSLDELAQAMRAVHRAQGRRLTVAWVLLGGINHSPAEAQALQDLMGDVPLRISIIDVNDARPDGFRRATAVERDAFLDALSALRVPMVRRFSVGSEQNSACGMLASTRPSVAP